MTDPNLIAAVADAEASAAEREAVAAYLAAGLGMKLVPTDAITTPGDLHPDEHSEAVGTTPRPIVADPASAGVPVTAGQNSCGGAEKSASQKPKVEPPQMGDQPTNSKSDGPRGLKPPQDPYSTHPAGAPAAATPTAAAAPQARSRAGRRLHPKRRQV